MTTFPICPSDRLQRRLLEVLDDELLPLSAFTGFTLCDDRENDEVKLPFIVARVTESDEIPQAGTVWHCRLNVNMVEDRQEANMTLGADSRPRHELRAENISATPRSASNRRARASTRKPAATTASLQSLQVRSRSSLTTLATAR